MHVQVNIGISNLGGGDFCECVESTCISSTLSMATSDQNCTSSPVLLLLASSPRYVYTTQ